MRGPAERISLGAATSWPASAPPGSVLLGEAGGIAGLVAFVGDDGVPQPFVPASFVPSNDNATDLGDASHRFRSLYLGTSIKNAGALAIELSGGSTTTLTVSNPTGGQVCDLALDGAAQIGAGVQLGGNLVFSGALGGPAIQAGGDLRMQLNGAGTRTLAIENTTGGQVANVTVDGSVTVGSNATFAQLSGGQGNISIGATEVLRVTTAKLSAPDEIGFLSDGGVQIQRYTSNGLRFLMGGSGVLEMGAGVVTVQTPLQLSSATPTITATATNATIAIRPNGTGAVQLKDNANVTKFAVDNVGIAFFDGTLRSQAAPIPDPTGGGTVDTEARAAIASILSMLRGAAGYNLIQT
jgi:hypothetical protein